ncbi:MAG: biotin--[acetyl-CoA-carboxylase] ligase [Bacillota bacterium]
MREEIMSLLKKSSPVPLSGEVIARRLGVSRTAVWKNIKSLQEMGYGITGSPRRGYILEQIPDLLYPLELGERLHTQVIAPLSSYIHYLPHTDSTNNVLKSMAEEGAPEGTVVVAECQETGRGRMGRCWSSPAGKGIYLSILLRPTIPPQNTSPLTLLAAVAVCSGIRAVLPRLSPGIKWPNDLLIGERKVCGILCEIKAEMDLVHYLVAGIGINVNTNLEDFPIPLRSTATSLRLANGGGEVSRLAVAAGVLQHYDELYREYMEAGAAPVLARWREYNITLGRRVKIQNPGASFTGIARELDRNGALVVEEETGEQRNFPAGEVTLL